MVPGVGIQSEGIPQKKIVKWSMVTKEKWGRISQ